MVFPSNINSKINNTDTIFNHNAYDNKGNLKNSKISPQSFLKNLYLDVPLVKKRNKVSEDDFEIPELHEHDEFITNNYNIKQLKAICKYYQLKVSGNKSQLYHRIYNTMKFFTPCIHIQKMWRGYRLRKFLSMRGPAVLKRKLCLNAEDFITLDPIEKIPVSQFFSFEQDGHVYGFDLCSLINYIKKHSDRKPNPYNRENFPKFENPPFPSPIDNKYNGTISQYIVKLVQISNKRFGMDVQITIDDDTQSMNKEERLKHRILILFQKINELGHYSDSTWFINLDRLQIIKFLKDLHDIWFYRSQLSESMRRQIVFPTGDPFANIVNVFQLNILGLHSIKELCVAVMEKFVTTGQTQDNKYLGSSHVLTALTLVSQDAAESMPWFYQSVA